MNTLSVSYAHIFLSSDATKISKLPLGAKKTSKSASSLKAKSKSQKGEVHLLKFNVNSVELRPSRAFSIIPFKLHNNVMIYQGPRYEFKSGGRATVYTETAIFESTRGATMVGAGGPNIFWELKVLEWIETLCFLNFKAFFVNLTSILFDT